MNTYFKHNGKYLSKLEYQRAKYLEQHPPKKKKIKDEKRRKPKKLSLPKPKKEFKIYKDYLASKEWAKLRKKVLKRSGGTCELCKLRKAYQVHHKTYKRIYKERLTDLIAVCGVCHLDKHKLLNDDLLEKTVNELMKSEGYH